jgi:hypothetical protein
VEATATLNAKKTQKNEQPASAAAPFQKKKIFVLFTCNKRRSILRLNSFASCT